MSIRAILLASVLGMPLVAGTALAGDLANAAKQRDRNAVQSLLIPLSHKPESVGRM